MALADVRAFYQRLARDEDFAQQMQSVNSKAECSQKVREAGFNFSSEEFEEYTSQLLEAEELRDLDEKELETVFGGAFPYPGGIRPRPPFPQPLYGVIRPPIQVQPMYGVIIPPPEQA